MSTNAKVMAVAANATMQDRVRLALAASSIVALGQADAPRIAYAKKVLLGTADFHAAAVAVLTNASIQASIAADNNTADFGVLDSDIGFVVAPSNVPANGIFATLATANS